jgi:hypothetical protein
MCSISEDIIKESNEYYEGQIGGIQAQQLNPDASQLASRLGGIFFQIHEVMDSWIK